MAKKHQQEAKDQNQSDEMVEHLDVDAARQDKNKENLGRRRCDPIHFQRIQGQKQYLIANEDSPQILPAEDTFGFFLSI